MLAMQDLPPKPSPLVIEVQSNPEPPTPPHPVTPPEAPQPNSDPQDEIRDEDLVDDSYALEEVLTPRAAPTEWLPPLVPEPSISYVELLDGDGDGEAAEAAADEPPEAAAEEAAAEATPEVELPAEDVREVHEEVVMRAEPEVEAEPEGAPEAGSESARDGLLRPGYGDVKAKLSRNLARYACCCFLCYANGLVQKQAAKAMEYHAAILCPTPSQWLVFLCTHHLPC